MFFKKLLAMILSALICPLLFTAMKGGISDFINNTVLSEKERETAIAEEKTDAIVNAQEDWFKKNKPTGVNPANVSDFTFKEYTYDDGIEIDGYMITKYNGKAKEVVIPTEYEGKFVIALDSGAFEGQDITSVTLPESTLYIGAYVFKDCKYLENINFPENLQKIWKEAFTGCKSLQSVTLGKNIKLIYDYAFSDCDSLKSVEIKGGVNPLKICEGVFKNCKSLQTVSIPDYTESIGFVSFSNCKALTDFKVTETGNGTGIELGHSAFEYCDGLKNFDASRFTKIDHSAFISCISLETITFSDSLESISRKAFENCASLKNVTLPDSLSLIEPNAFAGCTSLTSISIPSAMTEIKEGVFYKTGLTEIFIPSTVSYIGNSAFDGCQNLTKVEFAEDGEKLKIDFCAFANTGVEEITIPGRVTTVGNQAFVSCHNLKKVAYKSSGAAFADQNIDFKAFLDTPLEEIHIPATVDGIHEEAFPKDTVTIYCSAGSSAEEWAKKYDVKYVIE